MENKIENSEKKSIVTSWNIRFKQIKSREDVHKNIYKKITKKDFVMAFMFSFMFVFWIYWAQNYDSTKFKADLFDTTEEEVIYDWEESRTFSPTLSFYPENKIIENWTKEEWWKKILEYYTLETPDNIIEISLDNITSTPTCSHWWKYKFQWTSQYLKLWETINESDISVNWTNYPLLSNQDWINANYKIDSTWKVITIFFDKDIKNWKYYDFALEDWITIYENYKTLKKFNLWNPVYKISWNELEISFDNIFKTDFWRIIISENLISDLDWRINNQTSVAWKKIWDEIVIDNKNPEYKSHTYNNWILTILFSEIIIENPEKNLKNNISINWNYSEHNIEWNELKIFWATGSSFTLKQWVILDKNWNEIEEVVK